MRYHITNLDSGRDCHYQLDILLSPVEGRFRAVLVELGPQKALFDGLRVAFAGVEKAKICIVKVH